MIVPSISVSRFFALFTTVRSLSMLNLSLWVRLLYAQYEPTVDRYTNWIESTTKQTETKQWHEGKKSDRGFYRCTTLCESNGKSIFDSILYSSSTEKKNLQQIQSHSLTMATMPFFSCFFYFSNVYLFTILVAQFVVHYISNSSELMSFLAFLAMS